LPNSPNEPVWPEPADIVALNQYIVGETGEPFMLMNPGLLESACRRPANAFHYDVVDDVLNLGIKLLFGVAENHPFAQGNKRTGFEAMILFLELNGYDLDVPDSAEFADLIIAAMGQPRRQADLEAAMADYLQPLA
jgi:death-on-curing protein